MCWFLIRALRLLGIAQELLLLLQRMLDSDCLVLDILRSGSGVVEAAGLSVSAPAEVKRPRLFHRYRPRPL